MSGDGNPASSCLDPATQIPVCISLPSVEGDRCWDRIGPTARLDHPELFGTA